jgi:hypothetical protein
VSEPTVVAADPEAGVPWGRWAAIMALPATLLGVLVYPEPHLSPMALAPALGLLGLAGLLIARTGRLRLMILLPVVAAYVPSLQVGFAAILLTLALFVAKYGGQRLVRPLDLIDRLLLATLVWAGGSWAVNLGIETDLWSLPMLLVTFLAPWLLLFVARAAPWTPGDLQTILGVWLALALAQLGPALLKPLALGVPEAYGIPLILLQIGRLPLLRVLVGEFSADLITGTTQSAHHLGVLLLLALTMLVMLALATGRPIATLLLLVTLFGFLMTDSKHVVLAGIVPGAVLLRKAVWPALTRRKRGLLKVVALVLLLIVGPPVLVRALDLVVRDVWKSYVALSTINPKTQLILRTARVLGENDLQTWLGHGPGSFATRAATIRATDVLFKEEDRLPGFIPPHTGRTYRSVAFDLYTFDIADQARYRSGALTNPFSSLVGIIGEFGLAGSVLVFGFVLALAREGYRLWRTANAGAGFRAAGATLGFAMPLFVVLGIFDSYFEQPDLTGALAVLALVVIAARDATRAPA